MPAGNMPEIRRKYAGNMQKMQKCYSSMTVTRTKRKGLRWTDGRTNGRTDQWADRHDLSRDA